MLLDGKYRTIRQAHEWWRNEIPVVPVMCRDKKPMVPWRQWLDRKQPKPLLDMWFSKFWPCNLGIVLRNGLCVVDFDDPFSYLSWQENSPHLSKSYTVKTGRGRHVYLWLAREENYTYKFNGGELKCNGIVISPPSTHRTGRTYEEMSEFSRILGVAGIDDIGVELVDTKLTEQELIKYKSNSPPDPTSTVNLVKNNISIVGLLSGYTRLRNLGDGTLIAVCPFHDDRTPSLRVWPEENRCYCHAPGCVAHTRTDVIAAAAYLWNVSMGQATRMLARDL